MLVCDGHYRRTLRARKQAARKALPVDVAEAIDKEIDAIEALGDPWYSTRVITVAFRLAKNSLSNRTNSHDYRQGFQGHLHKCDDIGLRYGNWFTAVSVNKDTARYRSWQNPEDAIAALRISHRLCRYEYGKPSGNDSQTKIDQWRLENGNNGTIRT